MKSILPALVMLATAGAASAADLDQPSLAELKWVARPIVVFADAAADPRVARQLQWFEDRIDELEERDVVILVDTHPDEKTALRERFHPRDFMVVLVGKDGEVKYRKPDPVTVREIIRLIDRMPLRQQEIEAQRAGSG
ncbi:DUF4174 domain-containing protein [Oceanibium sediminis]|uniref:DUF4174 domain-containing protein n=1 Tax=Oceanibium sediminis TaxID=2026339 RepID=UPI000DD4BD22|nr:DUF4174 domain-containing protein [Oceanibium sediminis]